ncbi:hypothetical protein LHGZ1_2441 [Laribacter hongkongensis]|uniref:Uncharacterized protein n=1 Tax=Laribacter hongkongensis TaxID=168471 RepID=A0A248LKU7_9NEIS|nr:hypothetical protein LHGZ1_2441 [Laribacter hongkongensis]
MRGKLAGWRRGWCCCRHVRLVADSRRQPFNKPGPAGLLSGSPLGLPATDCPAGLVPKRLMPLHPDCGDV